MSHPQLHRRAFVLGLVALGAAGALAAGTGTAEALPALPARPATPETAPAAADAVFRPGVDDATLVEVRRRPRCYINTWGRRVCEVRRRRRCWRRRGRRVCRWYNDCN